MRVKRTKNRLGAFLCAAGLIGGLLAVTASPASAATIIVRPGQSIQAAVDAAPPGSTVLVRPGTYHETVTITRAGIRLQGSGANLTTILPPANPGGPCAFGPDFVQGVCVLGNLDQNFNVVSAVRGVSVTDFAVSGFTGSGIFVAGGSGTTIDRNRTDDNGEYGVFVLSSTGTRIRSNHASGNAEAGIYVGDSPNANATVTGNEVSDNGFGFFIRSASRGTISNNQAHDNCMGMFFLQAPDEPRDWFVTGNVVNHNNRACPATDEGPPVSGIGIQTIGARSLTIIGNTVLDNQPGGPTEGHAGIGIIESNDIRVTRNTALRNNPDLFWDGSGSGNSFLGNRCQTSIPPGLC